MKPVRIVILAVAAVAAVGLALIVRGALSGKPTSQAEAAVPISQANVKPMARVLVAKRDLKIGDRLTEADMDWQEWPVEAVNQAFVTDGSVDVAKPLGDAEPAADADKDAKDGKKADDKAKDAKPADAKAGKAGAKTAVADAKPADAATKVADMLTGAGPKAQFVGSVVREAFMAGEPIVARKLVRAGESGYLAVVIQPGMRAMSVSVSVETAAGGFILPGDRVDVLLAHEVEVKGQSGSRNAYVSETVLRNVRVLAVDQVTQPDKGATTVVGATATLELAPADSEALALAQAQGKLSLTLRSYADASGPSGRTPQVARDAQSAAVRSIRVFRGNEVTDVAVM
ncbi:Flp pilus assembly protein CpaB [Caulobacter sp. 17J65-9]|uniref:Flp pilus assembly protein CpaB n=1 Tax=Caulobacter sp. 17J65-9 TaxID=2709382 RepID=UPI0013C574E7|nr:Flp pilus assembly protein CpaB [Caulobacter sp. 17J65-9]NEX94689.1 Flp pilus assembly protein CpaB [Caulobacter sp. 17J65-9]